MGHRLEDSSRSATVRDSLLGPKSVIKLGVRHSRINERKKDIEFRIYFHTILFYSMWSQIPFLSVLTTSFK